MHMPRLMHRLMSMHTSMHTSRRMCAALFSAADEIPMPFIVKGAKMFNGHSGIYHLHYAHLAHYHTLQNMNCDR